MTTFVAIESNSRPSVTTTITVSRLIWAVIAVAATLDSVLLTAQGLTIAPNWTLVGLTAALYAMSLALGPSRRNTPAGCLIVSIVQTVVCYYVLAVLSYAVMAASPFPLTDRMLARADEAIGFDWLAWLNWVDAHPTIHGVLSFAYATIAPQAFFMIFFFSYTDPARVHALVLASALSLLIIIIPVMFVLPAIGAGSQHGAGIEPWHDDIVALRSHTLLVIGRMEGIISFPSFHTVMGVLFIYTARGRLWFPAVLVLNLLLIAATFTEGAHYAVDVISGVATAAAAIVMARYLSKRCATYILRESR